MPKIDLTDDVFHRQFHELKARDSDVILLYHVDDQQGDHYRAFGADARTICGSVAVRKSEGRYQITGRSSDWVGIFPGALEAILTRIVAIGKRIAICQQIQAAGSIGSKQAEWIAMYCPTPKHP
jgi:DNA mismatch repair ATPase MutS